MSEIETMRAMLRQLINRDAPPLSLADMRAAFDGWGESYPLPEGAATEPKTLGGIGALKASASRSRADRACSTCTAGDMRSDR